MYYIIGEAVPGLAEHEVCGAGRQKEIREIRTSKMEVQKNA